MYAADNSKVCVYQRMSVISTEVIHSCILLFLQEIVKQTNMTVNIGNSGGGVGGVCGVYLGSRLCLWRESLDNPHLLCFGLHSRAGYKHVNQIPFG